MGKKRKIISVCLAGIITASVCSCTMEQGLQTVSDIINGIDTADSEEVLRVKNSYLSQYSTDVTVGDALDGFLANPMWQYFKADTGENIVQCTGECLYREQNVEVKIQFQLNEDDTFQVYTIAFNDIAQNALMVEAFLNKVYEDYTTTSSYEYTTAVSSETENSYIPTEKYDNNSRNIVVVDNDLYELNHIGLKDDTLEQLNRQEIRILLNALYAYHGYTFEREEYRNFFSTKPWYTPLGKSMEECEAEFNEKETFNKNILVEYEILHGWR